MDFLNQFLWVIYPYLTIAIFVVGHFYRYNTDQLGWTSKSSEFLENKTLRWGSILFHVGILMVLGGHILGLMIPKSMTEKIGLTEHMYHQMALTVGGVAGIITIAGISILLFRRLNNTRVRKNSSFTDILIAILIFTEVAIGVYNTLGYNLFVGYDYRETISPWLRGFLMFKPDPSLMKDVPLFFQIHVLFGFTIFALWPFTRLVHVWSLPLEYFKRSYIIYRSRNAKRAVQLRENHK